METIFRKISVDDRMPPNGKYVVTIDEAGEMIVYQHTLFGWCMRDSVGFNSPNNNLAITHWLEETEINNKLNLVVTGPKTIVMVKMKTNNMTEQEQYLNTFKRGTKVIFTPENKVYDFGYISDTGKAIIYEEGKTNMQDSFVVSMSDIKHNNK